MSIHKVSYLYVFYGIGNKEMTASLRRNHRCLVLIFIKEGKTPAHTNPLKCTKWNIDANSIVLRVQAMSGENAFPSLFRLLLRAVWCVTRYFVCFGERRTAARMTNAHCCQRSFAETQTGHRDLFQQRVLTFGAQCLVTAIIMRATPTREQVHCHFCQSRKANGVDKWG